ncbi:MULTISPECIES: Crp/Fnr family transcriptional regulator [unclassified Tardiphaga]|uniref:Crp/Fnr family transcriptional regulator n=1 Tax=unclassified Tardiphaga TaxID=2631404 RepID=UPI00116543F1|nr:MULTISPECIES: Crp/Fnr family transcriptional regulator [unclassified Tardiphaga]QDM19906.1 Crp/Fnr family transcriptional regulator [Tardiphaga sp. vice154]
MADWLTRTIRVAGVERAFRAKQVLFRTGQRTAGFYEVITGNVCLVRVDRAGREAVLQIAAAGETLGEASLFASAYHCDGIATTDAVVRLYPKTIVLAEFERDPKAAQAFMAMLAHQVMNLRTRVEQRNINSAHDRVRHYLALNTGTDGRTIRVTGTLKDLATELGLTHETLYRTLADLAAAGEIERSKGKIKLM